MENESNYSAPLNPEQQIGILDEAARTIVNNEELRESLNDVRNQLAFEDRGWIKWWGSAWGVGEDILGLTLEEIQDVSLEIRSQVIGASLLKNAVELRSGYVWSKGVTFPGTGKTKGAGAPAKARKFFVQPQNQECLFTAGAFYEMEKAAYSDGNYYILGEDATKIAHRISISHVRDVYTNPQFREEVWAYLVCLPNADPTIAELETKWVYTDRVPASNRKPSIKAGNDAAVPVMKGFTIIDARFNRQTGYPLGIPDALPAVAWARSYSEGMKGGLQMQKALAYLAFKVTNKSAAGAANAAAKVAGGHGSGRTATMVDGQDMNPLSSAGKGYDFTSLDRVAGMVAAALQISLVSLLSSPGAAGSSYGAAATLDKPQQDAMRQRQEVWSDFYDRVFMWAVGDVAGAIFPPIVDVDFYRLTQAYGLAWLWGVLYPDEIRPEILNALGIESKHDKAPSGIMIPNNKNSGARIDVDPNGTAFAPAVPAAVPTPAGTDPASNIPTQTPAPNQGVSNGVGSTGGNDLRSDTISQAMNMMNLDRLEELVTRLEAANSRL